MKRRNFIGALATALAVPVAPRRIYSFLWDNPLVQPALPVGVLMLPDGGRIYSDGSDFHFISFSLVEKPVDPRTRIHAVQAFRRVHGDKHTDVERYIMHGNWKVAT